MLSDPNIELYDRLSEVSREIETSVARGDFSQIGPLASAHNAVMEQIRNIGEITDEKYISVIEKAEESVKKTMAVIEEKQKEILRQLTAEKNKKMLKNSYSA